MPAACMARGARPALVLAAAVLLGGGLAACGSPHNPAAYTRGYDAGLVARQHFIQQQGQDSNLLLLCAQAAYADIQDMAESVAQFWQDGFTLACAHVST